MDWVYILGVFFSTNASVRPASEPSFCFKPRLRNSAAMLSQQQSAIQISLAERAFEDFKIELFLR
jgi:hypothetical protein